MADTPGERDVMGRTRSERFPDTPGPGAEAIRAAAVQTAAVIVHGMHPDDGRAMHFECMNVAARVVEAIAPLLRAEARHCPTLCDADCEQVCHETHVVKWKRDHDPEQCRATFAAEAAASERIRQLAIQVNAQVPTHHEPVGAAEQFQFPAGRTTWAPFADLLREPGSAS